MSGDMDNLEECWNMAAPDVPEWPDAENVVKVMSETRTATSDEEWDNLMNVVNTFREDPEDEEKKRTFMDYVKDILVAVYAGVVAFGVWATLSELMSWIFG
jgi:hypothetical protein